MTSIFQAGQPFNIVRTSSTTYQANDKDLVISSGDEVALPSPNQGTTILVRPAPSIGSVKITTSNGTIGNTGETFGIYRATEPIYLVGDGTDWYARSGGGEISAIPDTFVERPADTDVGDSSLDVGTVLKFNIEWPAETIDFELSAGQNNSEYAEIVELSSSGSDDGTTIETANISDLSGGDQFTFDLSQKLLTSNEYAFVVGRSDGTNVDQARYDATGELPIVSSDGNLEMVEGILRGVKRDSRLNAFRRIGNLS